MEFAPHTLQLLKETVTRDSYGRILTHDTDYEDVCPCRCDDNSTQEFNDEEGHVYRSRHKIVCEPSACVVACGQTVRVLDHEGNVRGGGKVYDVRVLNYLPYVEIWV